MDARRQHLPTALWGVFVEFGWGGRVIDPATWHPVETTEEPSLWGHERLDMGASGPAA